MRSTLFVFKFHRYNHVVFKTYRNTTLFNLSEIDTAIEPCGQLENKRNTHQIERNSNSKCISVDLSDVPTYMKQFFRFLIWHTRTCNWCKRTKLVDWTQSWYFLLDDSMTCCQNLSILVFFFVRHSINEIDFVCIQIPIPVAAHFPFNATGETARQLKKQENTRQIQRNSTPRERRM